MASAEPTTSALTEKTPNANTPGLEGTVSARGDFIGRARSARRKVVQMGDATQLSREKPCLVDDARPPHGVDEYLRRQAPILRPLRCQHHQIRPVQRLLGGAAESENGGELRGERADGRVVRPHLDAAPVQPGTELDRRR